MAEPIRRPSFDEAARALETTEQMTRHALERGLGSRWFAGLVSMWIGGVAVATVHDGAIATGAIAALFVGGFVALALWRRRVVARVKYLHGGGGRIAAAVVIGCVLAVGLLGAGAFEAYDLSWVPYAAGALVAAIVFAGLEVFRRRTRAKVMAGDA